MNVLFVLHGDFVSNSALQVHALANALCRLGCDCAVVIDGDLRTYAEAVDPLYRPYTYAQAVAGLVRFDDWAPADIVHAWTPREKVRHVCQGLRALPGGDGFRLLIHLEDNEEDIVVSALGKPMRQLRAMSDAQLAAILPEHLSHPRRSWEFLCAADGITLLIETLGDFAPPDKPTLTFWPAADPALFYPRPVNWERRRELGIPDDCAVLVYAGNVHVANYHEVRSLYVATAILNREGRPVKLVRAGEDHVDFLGENRQWCAPGVISIGRLRHREVPDFLALADVLVQPGRAGAFNDYRFPSKLPEFFAMGRPVVVPATNVGLHAEHRRQAYVLPRADALGIAGAVAEIMADAALRETLSQGALEFTASHFSWARSAEKLLGFYQAHAGRAAAAGVLLGRAHA